MKSILGIFRAACFSPGMVGRDEAILRTVAEHLDGTLYTVSFIHEEDFTHTTPMPDIVLHMARSPRVLDMLCEWQKAGCRIINTVEGVRNTQRASLASLCTAQHIPAPQTWIVPTASPRPDKITFPCWVKRADTCAQEPNDVCYIADAQEYISCLSRFSARGIRTAVVMEHLEGTCFKFYTVRGTDFFHCMPAEELGYDKFSKTRPAQGAHRTEQDKERIGHTLKAQFSNLDLQLDVYGGDVIIAPDGKARLIDLNDWPSFSPCREDAARAIAQLVTKG